jgi:3-phosphoshikimate 1-carboxyvinyltransferase
VSKRNVAPGRKIAGLVEVPGDKSISHRYGMLAALASGRSEITGYAAAADCHSTLNCMERLGADVKRTSGEHGAVISITGNGLDGLRRSWRTLDAENSGTTMRLLTGILAGQSFDSTMTGDASLRKRPMRRVIDPLTKMGARIEARDENFAPLHIHASRLHPIQYVLPVASAQVKSAVLLAGLFAEGETSVEEPVCTRDHTEVALGEFGAGLRRQGRTIRITGRTPLQPRQLTVPGDLSSAVFLIAAALVLPDSDLMIHNVGLNPTRTAVLDVLCEWGAAVKIVSVYGETGELSGDIAVHHSSLKGGVLSGGIVAQLIDELPMLAALGPYTEEGIEIRDAGELRLKESDRVAVLAENLRRMGATVEERPDGLRVEGRSAGRLRGAEIDPADDHRMAMAFAIAALGASGPSVIRAAECVAISFPDFFPLLERLVDR